MKILILDPGHQNYPYADTGCSGFGLHEEDIVLDICKRAQPLIIASGIQVIMTRDGATVNGDGSSLNASLNTRCQIANNANADFYLSVHADAFNGSAYGTSTHIYGLGGGGERFAKIISPQMGQLFNNRGIKVSNFQVIRETKMSSALLETAFLDNQGDNAKLADPNVRQQIAVIIAKSVCTYFGVVFNGVVTPVVFPVQQPTTIVNAPVNNIPAPVQQETTRHFSYPNNARCTAQIPVKDANGNLSEGHFVSAGDVVTVINVSYSRGLIELEYPVGLNQVRSGFVSVSSNIVYLSPNAWHNGSTKEDIYNEANKGLKIGSLSPHEYASPLYKKNGFIHLVYNTDKGLNSKSGYSAYMAGL